MDCEEYRANYRGFRSRGPEHNAMPPELAAWHRHRQSCRRCSEWSKRAEAEANGIDPSQHCCADMAMNVSRPLLVPHQGPNRVIDWIACWDEYYIPVAYDGYSATRVLHCPWCGTRLGESRKALWYQSLYSLGYADPGEEDIPPEFDSDAWWRKTGA
jgi:hypothetical protein